MEKERFKEERKKREQFEGEKNEIERQLDTKTELARLQSLVERGLLKPETLERALEDGKLSEGEIEEVFAKIDEIENVEEIDKILPKESRPTKEEFLEAVNSEPKRIQMLTKLNSALRLVTQTNGGRGFAGGLFGNFMLFLSKSLRTVQENLIDVKRALQKIPSTEIKK